MKKNTSFKIFSGLDVQEKFIVSKHNENKAAVIAHYCHEPIWDESFLTLITLVAKQTQHIVVVTTHLDMPELPSKLSHVRLIRRPNIGYDFYSYRVGLTYLLENNKFEGIFLINSSFILLNSARFLTLLNALSDPKRVSAIRGVTASTEVAWHLQSYLLYFDIKKLPENWLTLFFEAIEPVNSKVKLILAYEIGLGRLIKKQKIKAENIYFPSLLPLIKGILAWFKRKMPSAERFHLLKPRTWRYFGGINWCHFSAYDLAQHFGFIKTEVLCKNPHNLPLNGIMNLCETSRTPHIEAIVKNIKSYAAQSKNTISPFYYQQFESKTIHKKPAKVAVALHLYYLDLLDEIFTYLKHIPEPFDLYITTPFEADVGPIFNKLDTYGQPVKIILIENRGRDVAPFIALYRSKQLDHYDAVLKLHSKKSAYNEALGTLWRRDLYQLLCGNSSIVTENLLLFRTQPIGVIGPEKYFLDHWGTKQNKHAVKTLLMHTTKHQAEDELPTLGFFAGTMFWFSPKAFSVIHDIPLAALQFEREADQEDNTLAHAWERAFCVLSQAAGYTVTSQSLAGQNIFLTDATSQNSVPRLSGFRIPRVRDFICGMRWIKRRMIHELSLLHTAFKQ